jgi:ABC-2 type transport system ATP-binding protein
MISTRNLTKRFGPFVAVDDVTLSVDRGEVLGFLGPNGAGKSTTMKMIAGFLRPTSGTATVCDIDVLDQPLEAKRRIGYLPEGAPSYPDMTPDGFLGFIAEIRGYNGAEKRRRVAEAVERVELGSVLYQTIDTLSKGFKRRVGLAQALLHDPEVLVMDEPTDGLDPNQKYEVRRLIASMAADKAIIISTHILEEVDAICTRAVIISNGKLVADGTPEQLEARSRYHCAVTITLAADRAAAVRSECDGLSFVREVELRDSQNDRAHLTLLPRESKPIIAEVGHLVRERGWEVDEIRIETGHLDEVFRSITVSSE